MFVNYPLLLSYNPSASLRPTKSCSRGRSSSSLSSSLPLDNSFVHFLYLTTLLYSFSSPFHATSQNARSLASYYFVLIMAAVVVPRLLVNGNRTGGAAAVEVLIGDSLSCNRPLHGQPPGLRGAKARKPAREELEFERKHGYIHRQFFCMSHMLRHLSTRWGNYCLSI